MPRPARATVTAEVFLALYGMSHPAFSEEPTERQPRPLAEVTVTANRRQQTIEEVPYSLSVVSGDELTRTGVTDIPSLTAQVPGLSMYDFGARASGADFPIIRGLNASAGGSLLRTINQSPVGTYIGNSPIEGYFQLNDVQRVEVLRGPQGTLYGAGALGGALRIIPNSPELGRFGGDIEASGGSLAHSSDASYTVGAMLNVPLGDTLGLRVSGKYAYEPGFIHVYGILKGTGSSFSDIPVLANPADPVNSSGIFENKSDWNDQNTLTARASLLWKPFDKFSAELAFTYSNLNGEGAPTVNVLSSGGPYPIDPRITFPPGGKYRSFSAAYQPYSRRTSLASLDLSYDAGFATLSMTSSYYKTTGSTAFDFTYGLFSIDALVPGFIGYYAGNPVNPRFVALGLFTDSAHTFTQEVRLVSTTSPNKLFDYVVGMFYETQEHDGTWAGGAPGSPERSEVQGCTAPYFIGANFPNCAPGSAPGDLQFLLLDDQHFTDKSVFGELTWHFTRHGQITFGGRHSHEDFTDTQSYLLYTFPTFVPAHEIAAPTTKNTWKIGSSYEYAADQFFYVLWSQGFRRGGTNAFPPSGIYQENPALSTYVPDSVNNYEMGLKGQFAKGIRYSFDVFDDHWNNAQVAGSLPDGNPGVWNAKKARSKGVEFDLSSPLFLQGLRIAVAGAYVDAKFTQDYFYQADLFGNVFANAGQQLPGSPKVSAAATITYQRNIAPSYDLVVSLNDTYRSAMVISNFPLQGQVGSITASGMNIANLSASISHHSWRLGIYATNIADKLVLLSGKNFGVVTAQTAYVNNLSAGDLINRPREVGLRLGYTF